MAMRSESAPREPTTDPHPEHGMQRAQPDPRYPQPPPPEPPPESGPVELHYVPPPWVAPVRPPGHAARA